MDYETQIITYLHLNSKLFKKYPFSPKKKKKLQHIPLFIKIVKIFCFVKNFCLTDTRSILYTVLKSLNSTQQPVYFLFKSSTITLSIFYLDISAKLCTYLISFEFEPV